MVSLMMCDADMQIRACSIASQRLPSLAGTCILGASNGQLIRADSRGQKLLARGVGSVCKTSESILT
jgi:hypothetical protein